MQQDKSPKSQKSDAYKYTSMSIKMAVVITAGAVGGYKLDQLIGWKFPLLTLVLSMTSVALAIYIMILDTRK